MSKFKISYPSGATPIDPTKALTQTKNTEPITKMRKSEVFGSKVPTPYKYNKELLCEDDLERF